MYEWMLKMFGKEAAKKIETPFTKGELLSLMHACSIANMEYPGNRDKRLIGKLKRYVKKYNPREFILDDIQEDLAWVRDRFEEHAIKNAVNVDTAIKHLNDFIGRTSDVPKFYDIEGNEIHYASLSNLIPRNCDKAFTLLIDDDFVFALVVHVGENPKKHRFKIIFVTENMSGSSKIYPYTAAAMKWASTLPSFRQKLEKIERLRRIK